MIEKKILILGAGYISSCLVNYFVNLSSKSSGPFKYVITVASLIQHELENLSRKFPGGGEGPTPQDQIETVLLDVNKNDGDEKRLKGLVGRADLVVSLLPNDKHFKVAQSCISSKVPMLHASYNTPELESLNSEAEKAGILILGEMGLDPGIDHFLALKCVDEIHSSGGKVVSFASLCGGLPSPKTKYEDDNPLHYKFSWSPKTALKNLKNEAKFKRHKSTIQTPEGSGGALSETRKVTVHSLSHYHLECHPNRDSLSYMGKYRIEGDGVKNMIRGTLRYQGFAEGARVLLKLGFLGEEKLDILDSERNDFPPMSWREFTTYLVAQHNANTNKGHTTQISIPPPKDGKDDAWLRHHLTKEEYRVLQGLGLISEALLDKLGTPLDTLSKHLERTLKYKPGEQDLVILHIHIESKYSKSISSSSFVPSSLCATKEVREVDFIVEGDPYPDGYSAMSKTVAYTLGIGAEWMLKLQQEEEKGTEKKGGGGVTSFSGVKSPVTIDHPELLYNEVLEKLSDYGMFAIERISDT